MDDPILKGQLNGIAKTFGNKELSARKFLRHLDACKKTLDGCAHLVKEMQARPEKVDQIKVLCALCASMTKLAAAQQDLVAFAALQSSGETGKSDPLGGLGDLFGGLGK